MSCLSKDTISAFKQPKTQSLEVDIRGLLVCPIFPSGWCSLTFRSVFQDTFDTLERVKETQSTEVKTKALVVHPLSTFPPYIFIDPLIPARIGFVTQNL